MEIKICEQEDQIIALATCAKAIWNEYFVSLLSQEQIDYMVEQFLSAPVLTKAICKDGYTYFLAYDNNEIIGFCGVQPQAKRLFLSKLYLKKQMRGKGLSSLLLQEAICFAKQKGCEEIYLTCNKYNTQSLDIYRHKGFSIIDQAISDIGHGFVMDDYILSLPLLTEAFDNTKESFLPASEYNE